MRKTNTLFYGDNLAILREHVEDESIDLVYLDPPSIPTPIIICCSSDVTL
jgi:16S rRNA G966 N2-methylase RsmD